MLCHIAPVLLGRNTFIAFEYPGEIALVTETALIGDLNQGKSCVGQQRFAMRDPCLIDIINNTHTCFLLEDAAEIGFA